MAPSVERNLSVKNKLKEGGNVTNTSDGNLLTHGDDILSGKH